MFIDHTGCIFDHRAEYDSHISQAACIRCSTQSQLPCSGLHKMKFCPCNIMREKFGYKAEEEATGWRNVQSEDSLLYSVRD